MIQENTGADTPTVKNDSSNTAIILSGVIEHVRYHREDTGYTIARVRPQGPDESSINVVAFLPSPRIGDLYQFKGSWVVHPKYGRQFQAAEFEAKPPVTMEGIRSYLTSEIEEIGPELAKRIVDAFGMDTFNIIDFEPHRLREVSRHRTKTRPIYPARYGRTREFCGTRLCSSTARGLLPVSHQRFSKSTATTP